MGLIRTKIVERRETAGPMEKTKNMRAQLISKPDYVDYCFLRGNDVIHLQSDPGQLRSFHYEFDLTPELRQTLVENGIEFRIVDGTGNAKAA
jgi:hypothetical protein